MLSVEGIVREEEENHESLYYESKCGPYIPQKGNIGIYDQCIINPTVSIPLGGRGCYLKETVYMFIVPL